MPDLSSVAREAADSEARRRINAHMDEAANPQGGSFLRGYRLGFTEGFTECASRLPSEDELAEALAAHFWARDTGEAEPWADLPAEDRENVIENFDTLSDAKAVLALIGEKIRENGNHG